MKEDYEDQNLEIITKKRNFKICMCFYVSTKRKKTVVANNAGNMPSLFRVINVRIKTHILCWRSIQSALQASKINVQVYENTLFTF